MERKGNVLGWSSVPDGGFARGLEERKQWVGPWAVQAGKGTLHRTAVELSHHNLIFLVRASER